MLTREQYDNTTALIAALRSGEYTQTIGALAKVRNGKESNCCLGVGCRLAGLTGKVMDTGDLVANRIEFEFPNDTAYASWSMPDPMWFESHYGINCAMQEDLATMNDEVRNFDYIADHIEMWLNEQSVNIEQTSSKE
jgi:hypothetical protein